MLFLFYALVFWPRRMWHVAPQPGMEPTAPAMEGKVLTTGPQGSPKSLCILLRAPTPEHWGQRGALGRLGLLPLLPNKDGTPTRVWSGPPGAWQSQPSARPEPGAQAPSAQVSPATHSSSLSSICQVRKIAKVAEGFTGTLVGFQTKC